MKIFFYRAVALVPDINSKLLSEFTGRNPSISFKLEPLSFKDLFSSLTMKAYLIYFYSKYILKYHSSKDLVIKSFDGAKLIGVICVVSKYKRFRFLFPNDKQFGNVTVLKKYRGRNIAYGMILFGLGKVRADRYWYLVSEHNHGSIRVAQKSGFSLVDYGYKLKNSRNLLELSSYELTSTLKE